MFKKKVILDTNFLMLPGSLGIDIFSDLEALADFKVKFCVIDKTLDELWGIAQGNSKDALNAKMGIIMLQNKGLKKLDCKNEETVDDAIVRHSKDVEAVATQDKELKERIKGNCKIIVLKGKKKIDWG